MMADQLFHIGSIQQHEQVIEVVVGINAGHPIFAGHFPGRPVVPGVCQLELAETIVKQYLQIPLQVYEVLSAKYVAPINPIDTPEVAVKFTIEKADTLTTFSGTITAGDQVFCRLKCRAKA